MFFFLQGLGMLRRSALIFINTFSQPVAWENSDTLENASSVENLAASTSPSRGRLQPSSCWASDPLTNTTASFALLVFTPEIEPKITADKKKLSDVQW